MNDPYFSGVADIRRGDIYDETAETDARDLETTIIGALGQYLVRITKGPRLCGPPRYSRQPESGPRTPGGFKMDDWMRAFWHLLFFLRRRNNCCVLDGTKGPDH